MPRLSFNGRLAGRLAAALFACAYCMMPFSLPPDASAGMGIDSSWMIGLTQAAGQGEISGRDLFSTYGVLFQGLGRLAQGLHATGSLYDSLSILLFLQNLLAVGLLALCLFLIDRIGGHSVLFVMLMLLYLGFLQAALHRPLAALVAVLVLWRTLRAETQRRRLQGTAGAALLAFLAQLLTFDMGIFAVATGVAGLAALALLSRFGLPAPAALPRPRDLLALAATLVGTFLAANLGLGIVFALTGPAGTGVLTYWTTMLQIVQGYNYTLSSPWSLQKMPVIVLGLLALYVLGFVVRHLRRLAATDLALFLFLGAFAAVMLKSATVRADMGHIWLGVTPLVMTFLLLGRDWLGERWINPSWIWSGLLLLLLGVWAGVAIERIQLPFALLHQGIRPWQNLPGLATFAPGRLVALPKPLAESRARGGLLVFPYQDYLAALAGRPLVAPLIQAYQADTAALERLYTARLAARKRPFEVLYAFDGTTSLAFEGVQQVSRNPGIFEYLYGHFQPVVPQTPDPGYLLLERRAAPRRLAGPPLAFHPNAGGPAPYPGVILDRPAACSLVRLTLRFDYPRRTVLGRASQVAAIFSAGGVPLLQAPLVSLNGRGPFSTYVSLLPAESFRRVLAGPPGIPGVAFDRLSFVAADSSFLAFAPWAVHVDRLDCLNF